MAAGCFEWAVEIMIFIVELIRHRYEYTSHAYPLLTLRCICSQVQQNQLFLGLLKVPQY